ncbi:MAG: SlyX family protein [Azonexus sp.]|nr:SlyX family protein [Azonexus sp.]
MESRLNDLEIKISFHEDQIDALNRTVFRQQQQLEFLFAELRSLRDQMSSAQPGEFRSLRDEIPPHY